MTESKPKAKPSRFSDLDIVDKDTSSGTPITEVTNQPTEIVCLLDRSGSMGSIVDDAIGGFNSFLNEQQNEPGEATMTIILFDDKIEVLENGTDIKEVTPLNNNTYVPRGSTALNDAVGEALVKLKERNPKNAIICILTDGQENSSRTFSKQQIKDMLKECTDKGWFVAYLSASVDAFADAQSIGIGRGQSASFQKSSDGIATATLGASYATREYRTHGAHGMMMGRMASMQMYTSQASQDLKAHSVSGSSGDFSGVTWGTSTGDHKKKRSPTFR